jgi:rubrerythrin
MSERDFRCETCGNKTKGTAQPYQCSVCGGTQFHYMTSAGKLHGKPKEIWEL